MTDSAEMGTLAADRSKTWWLLSRLYLERPEPAFLGELVAALAATPTQSGLGKEVQALRGGIQQDRAELSRRLGVEYTRLFRGIREGLGPPPPFESLYRGGALMSGEGLAVLDHYRAAGFTDIEPEAGPQDHLGVELRFLALLCYREMEAREMGEEDQALQRIAAQRGFLDEHLLAWLPGYAQCIADESREPFYAAATNLALAFAAQERAELELVEGSTQVA